MEEREQDELVLRLTIEYLKDVGRWPKLVDLHQRIHQELHLKVDVQAAARRLAPQPFVGGGYSYLGETFAPPVSLIAQSDEGYRLLEVLVRFIDFAKDKYQSARGQPEVTSREFIEKMDVDENTGLALRQLMSAVPFITDGGSSNHDGWRVTIADRIVGWPDELTPEGLLTELDRLAVENQAQAAALSSAHYDMIQASRKTTHAHLPSTRGADSGNDPVSVLERHPAVRAVLLLGGIGSAIVAIGALVSRIL